MSNPKISTQVFLPTNFGNFEIQAIDSAFEYFPHLIIESKKAYSNPCLLRIHSECFTGDVLGSRRCDCGFQLHYSLNRIDREGGLLIYLRQEGRGIGLAHKLEAYALQDKGLDTFEANKALGFESDEREYSIVIDILKKKSIHNVKLISNSPQKINYLTHNGIHVQEVIPIIKESDDYNRKYLETKREKMGHIIPKDF